MEKAHNQDEGKVGGKEGCCVFIKAGTGRWRVISSKTSLHGTSNDCVVQLRGEAHKSLGFIVSKEDRILFFWVSEDEDLMET